MRLAARVVRIAAGCDRPRPSARPGFPEQAPSVNTSIAIAWRAHADGATLIEALAEEVLGDAECGTGLEVHAVRSHARGRRRDRRRRASCAGRPRSPGPDVRGDVAVDHRAQHGVTGRILLTRALIAPPHVGDRRQRSTRSSRRPARADRRSPPRTSPARLLANSGSSGVTPSPSSQRWSTRSHVVTIIITTSGCVVGDPRRAARRRSSDRIRRARCFHPPSRRSPPRRKPQPGAPTTSTWARSGCSAAHASSPAAVARAVESPATMIRTGRESAGSGGSVVVVVVVVVAAVVVRGTSMPSLGCVVGAVVGGDGARWSCGLARCRRGRLRRCRRSRAGLSGSSGASVDVDRGGRDRGVVGLPVLAERGGNDGQRDDRHRRGRQPAGDQRRAPARAAIAADRLLEHAVRDLGDRQRQRQLHDDELPAVEARAPLVGDHVDRPVVQVHAVRDPAEPDQRPASTARAAPASRPGVRAPATPTRRRRPAATPRRRDRRRRETSPRTRRARPVPAAPTQPAMRGTARPCSSSASSAPIRISPIRAGVAQ